MTSRVYISGLFIIPGNPKRSPHHYFQLLKESLRYAKDSTLYFFSNSNQIKEDITKISQEFNIKLIWESLEIKELPVYTNLLENAPAIEIQGFEHLHKNRLISREKIFEHYFIDSKSGSDRDTFKMMQAVWLSKIHLVNIAITKENAAREFCWFDASVSRFKQRANANFSEIKINPERVHHYSSIMRFFGKRLPLNASVLMGSSEAWLKLLPIYHEQLECLIHCGLPIDEEIVLMNCLSKFPELFDSIDKTSERNLLHKVIGRLLFPANGFILRCLNYDDRSLK